MNKMQKVEDIDGAANTTNVSSENDSILLPENGESMVQLAHNIEDIDGAANANESSKNNSILPKESKGSTIKLSMRSYCYTWTIDNFFECLNFCLLKQFADIHFNFNSPSFMFLNTEWCLHLSVITVNEQSNSKVKEMKITLESKSNIPRNMFIKNEVRIVDDDGKVLILFSPRNAVDIGNKKEYYYSFLPLRGIKTFVSPYKLIVCNEFSTLMSEISEDTGSFVSKCENQNVVESECSNSKASFVPPPPRCSKDKSSVLQRIRTTSWPSFVRVSAAMREFLFPILVTLCVLSLSILLVHKDHSAMSTTKSNEINHLIFDYAKLLSFITDAHNITAVKDKSLEFFVLYSKMYNSSDHVLQSTDSTDHVIQSTSTTDHDVPEMQSIDSNTKPRF